MRNLTTCTILFYLANEHAQFCGIARLIHVEYGINVLFLRYKPHGVSQSPSQSVSLTAHSHLSGLMVKPCLRSQHKIVANSLTWWFQSLEKAPSSLYLWLHNIIWIHVICNLIMRTHVIGIHIYHMNFSSIFGQYISIIAWEMSGEHLSPLGVSSTCIYQMVWWLYRSLDFCCQAQTYSIAY